MSGAVANQGSVAIGVIRTNWRPLSDAILKNSNFLKELFQKCHVHKSTHVIRIKVQTYSVNVRVPEY